MRYHAFIGELPLDAFKPIGGRMTLHGGGNPVSDVADVATDAVSSAVDTVKDVGSTIDQTVHDVVPGGWTGAALLAAGAYYAPEIGAWLDSSGAVVPGSSGVAPEALSGIDLGGAGASPASWGAGGAGTTLGTIGGAAGAGAAGGSALSGMLPYMVGGQVATGLMQANAAQKAADIQSAAAQGATQLQGQMFNTVNQQQAPQRALGYNAVNQIGSLGSGTYGMYDANGNPIGVGQGSGYLTHQFDASDLAKGLAPNYDFMLQQGQMANQRAANMGGGALGGNALQGLNKYTQDYAGNAYQNAFTNYQNQRSNIYNTLAGIAGIGQTGQDATNTALANATNAASQLGVGSAAAQAAGLTGSTAALGNTVGNVANTYMLANLLGQKGSVA